MDIDTLNIKILTDVLNCLRAKDVVQRNYVLDRLMAELKTSDEDVVDELAYLKERCARLELELASR